MHVRPLGTAHVLPAIASFLPWRAIPGVSLKSHVEFGVPLREAFLPHDATGLLSDEHSD